MLLQLTFFLLIGHSAVFAKDVETEYGTVRGHTVTVILADGVSTKNVTSYLGIPFATPPVGDLRFERPLKAQPWTDVFVADTLGNVCMQNPLSVITFTHPGWTKFSEDCLNLNIFAPEDLSGGPLPVMVWIYGGAYVSGGNIQYPGHFLATKDVVVVLMNYRLGVFGFANTADGLLKGNMGLFDQGLALEFVRDNIRNFGGDPDRVTIFGESAGGASTSLQLLSPLARGLFIQGIAESGSDNSAWTVNPPEQHPENYIYQVAENANCTTDTTEEMVACLRELDERDLRRADRIDCTPGFTCLGIIPIVDGPGGYVPDRPLTLRQNLGENSVPLLSGICKDDGALFTLAYVPESVRGGYNHSMFEYYLWERILAPYAPRMTEKQYEDAFEAINFYYTNWPYIDDLEANRQAVNKILTDTSFGYSWDRQSKINSEYAATYNYIMAFRSLNASSTYPEWMGVPHMGELPYVWGLGNLLINPDVRNDSGIYYDMVGYTPEDITYAEYVQTLWTNFAKYGNPTPTPVQSPFNDTLTVWPQFRADDNFKVLYLDAEISVKELYNQRNYAFYTEYMTYLTGQPIFGGLTEPHDESTRFSAGDLMDGIGEAIANIMSSRYPELAEIFVELKDMF